MQLPKSPPAEEHLTNAEVAKARRTEIVFKSEDVDSRQKQIPKQGGRTEFRVVAGMPFTTPDA